MLSGSMVALVTPMNEDLSIDYVALESLLEWHIAQGTKAIVATGTTGESATLNHDEHKAVIDFAIQTVAGRVPVIAGTGSNSTAEAIELTIYAKQAGADACLLVSPYYNKPSQAGLIAHHQAIAKAVAIPQILYNVPGRTAVDMQPQTVQVLAKEDHIIGIKEATGSIQRLRDIQVLVTHGFDYYTGDDATAVDFLANGGTGGISVTANIAPDRVADINELAIAGDVDQAKSKDASLQALHQHLFCEANPIPVKWALAQMDKIQPHIRLPLTTLNETCQTKLRSAMQAAHLL